MKKLIFIFILMAISLQANTQKILVTNVAQGSGADSISTHKIYTATKLAIEMTSKYISVADSTRNAIAALAGEDEKNRKVEELGIDYFLFTSIDVFHGMLRANITIVNSKTEEENTGYGYAPLHYIKDGNKIYDVAMLTALQRAMMNVLKDSTLYNHQPKEYQSKPAKSLVVGGFMFDDNDAKLIWKIFNNKSVMSYFASESIYQAAKKSDNYAVYDLNTRDSMYATFNLFLMENSTPPSKTELKILNTFAVDNFIFGSIKRVKSHAEVKIVLTELKDGNLIVVRSEVARLEDDYKDDFEKLIKSLTNKVLLIDDNK
ncbi:MAG: hypothetical protein KDC55_05125 [Ignavibacteriae bacterium]|nr:hypothetical protein [Ignavibacteriota bacterium]MCB9222012.1 hypothetical protein [Ignavibacteria bacterium]